MVLKREFTAETYRFMRVGCIRMTMNGVINGGGDNKLSPKGNATRAQGATMLMRFEAIEQ